MSILKNYRISNNLTQREMADVLGITIRSYRNYEQGKRKMPYLVLAKFLYIRNLRNDRMLSKILQECLEENVL